MFGKFCGKSGLDGWKSRFPAIPSRSQCLNDQYIHINFLCNCADVVKPFNLNEIVEMEKKEKRQGNSWSREPKIFFLFLFFWKSLLRCKQNFSRAQRRSLMRWAQPNIIQFVYFNLLINRIEIKAFKNVKKVVFMSWNFVFFQVG